jgi:hypothetical protein
MSKKTKVANPKTNKPLVRPMMPNHTQSLRVCLSKELAVKQAKEEYDTAMATVRKDWGL